MMTSNHDMTNRHDTVCLPDCGTQLIVDPGCFAFAVVRARPGSLPFSIDHIEPMVGVDYSAFECWRIFFGHKSFYPPAYRPWPLPSMFSKFKWPAGSHNIGIFDFHFEVKNISGLQHKFAVKLVGERTDS